jgi:hypothetical protein
MLTSSVCCCCVCFGITVCPTCGVSGGGFVDLRRREFGLCSETLAPAGGAGESKSPESSVIVRVRDAIKPGTMCGDVICNNGHVYCQRCYEPAHMGMAW